MPEEQRTRRIDLIVALLAALCVAFSWMSPEVSSPNERSRIYLAHAISERGSITIDEEVERWGMIFDIAHAEDHFFTDKAPGSSLLAVPVVMLSDDSVSIERLNLRVRRFVMVPITFLGGWLFLLILGALGISDGVRRLSLIGLIVGTSVLHYGGAFFGHGVVMTATLGALYSVVRATDGASRRSTVLWAVMAGLACGAAFAVEYQAVGLSLMLGAGLLSDPKTRRAELIGGAAMGAILLALPVLAYNNAAFGGPFSTSYAHLYHQHSIDIHSAGLGGVTRPHWEAVRGLLFSRSRGILFGAPIVFMGLFGLPSLWRRSRWVAVSTIGLMLWFLYLGTSIEIWYGGWGFGSRLLLPMFGVAALSAAALADAHPKTVPALIALVLSGVAYNVAVSSTFPEPPETVLNPLVSVATSLAARGAFSPNLGMGMGLHGAWSVLPLFVLSLGLSVWATERAVTDSHPRRALSVGLAIGLIWWALIWLLPEVNPGEVHGFVDWVAGLRVDPLP